MQGIYAIIHIDTGRSYVGSSINIEKRWIQHRQRMKSGRHPAKHMAAAFLKYGEAAFSFVVLEEIASMTEAVRIERENHWMRAMKPIFNVAPVAGSIAGLVRPDEVKKKMGDAQRKRYAEQGNPIKGRPRTDEAKAAISSGKVGKKLTAEHIANMSAALKGRLSPRKGVTLSEETKRRISESKSGKKQSAESVAKRSQANSGRKRTPEQCANISAGKLAKKIEKGIA